MLTQKYKQQQQQVRVQTNESNYAKGMFFSDVPLTEGYSKLLVNWDIDPTTGKLTPRKGLRTNYLLETNRKFTYGTYNLHHLKYVYSPNNQVATQRNTLIKKRLLGVGLMPNAADFTEQCVLFDMPIDENIGEAVRVLGLYTDKYVYDSSILPYTLKTPQIHGQKCVNNKLFTTPIGTYAFNNNYYTFLTIYRAPTLEDWRKIGTLTDAEYTQLFPNNHLNTTHPLAKGEPCTYYTCQYTITDTSSVNYGNTYAGVVYYNGLGHPITTAFVQGGTHQTAEEQFKKTLEELNQDEFNYVIAGSELCYAKLGKDIKDDTPAQYSYFPDLDDDKYYLCTVVPQVLNPTEAASWGYNMLLDDPYKFVCEKTATNTITILGILPYDNSGKVTLTPRKNQEITLKAYYRAPEKFYTDVAKGTYYATTKQYIGSDKRDPETKEDIPTNLSTYSFGSWWYCTLTREYYMVVPGKDLKTKVLDGPSYTKPAASVLLKPAIDSGTESEVRVRWQIRTVDSSDWIDIYNETVKFSEQVNQPFAVTTTMSSDELLVKFTISDPASVDELTNEEIVITTNTIGLSLVSDELATTLNLNPIKYDLGTCSGMCEWEQRLVLWGVHDALNIVFVSDVNNPTFFPYPNNVDTFPDPIRAVYPFGDELLVLTAKALYRLTWNTDGLGWTHHVIQQNLNIAQEDAHMCCVIKNMFFFKSGNYYYMMVPKNTASGVVGTNTSIAPIAKPIEGLLDNFHDEITNLVETISDKPVGIFLKNNLLHYYTVATDNKVIINYVYDYGTAARQQAYKEYFIKNGNTVSDDYIINNHIGALSTQPNNTFFVYVQLIYNTDLRAWTMRMFSTTTLLIPIEHTILQNEQYAYTYHINSNTAREVVLGISEFNNNLQVRNKDKNGIEYLGAQVSEDTIKDALHTSQYTSGKYTILGLAPDAITTTVEDEIITIHNPLNNYQYLDTGNRDINTDMKKRFREFQFKIRNINATSLGMKTSFLIDGSLRRDLQKFSPRYITDESTGEAVIVIERTLDNNPNYLSFVPEYKITRVERVIASTKMVQDAGELTPTTLAESTDPDYWVIDQSAFPGRTFWKVRVAISGKGYTPRAILLSTNLKSFEVLGHNWVYRTMHGR